MSLLQISEPGQSPDPHQRRIAVGIDLGTTHSLVAAVRNGVAECLPDGQGGVILPSVVRYLEGGGRQIGLEAHAAQRVAMQWSVRINEAYQRLKDPQKRAAYLCELRGCPIDAENNTAMPADFLVEQMEWREELDEARSMADLDVLENELDRARRDTLQRIERMLDDEADARGAAQQVRALMFIERFGHDVEKRVDQLGQ